jgi:DNA-binding MarR family transcriptional regulator
MMLDMDRSTSSDKAPIEPSASVPEAPSDEARAVVLAISADLQDMFGRMRRTWWERMVQQGLSTTHLHVLSVLEGQGEMTMSRLAELLSVTQSNVTGLIDRLEERGLVERERDRADRRVYIVRLSEGGRRQLADIQMIREELLQTLLAPLDLDELRCLERAFALIRRGAPHPSDFPSTD